MGGTISGSTDIAGAAGEGTGGSDTAPPAGEGGAPPASGGEGGALHEAGSGGAEAGEAGAFGAPSDELSPLGEPEGVVETSGSYIVFFQSSDRMTELMLKDLETDAPAVDVGGDAVRYDFDQFSADGRVHVSGAARPPLDAAEPVGADVFVTRFTESGYVPAVRASGFDDPLGRHFPIGFDASSRFAFLARDGEPSGWVIVDVARNALHHSGNDPRESHAFRFAPKGPFFAVLGAASGNEFPFGYIARITEGGVSEPRALPRDSREGAFSPDGTRFFYALRREGEPIAFGYIEPPGQPREFFAHDVVHPEGSGAFQIEPGADSIVAALPDDSGDDQRIVQRLFIDPARQPETILGPGPYVPNGSRSEGGIWAFKSRNAEGQYGIDVAWGGREYVLVEPQPLPFQFYFFGENLVYVLDGGLYSARFEGEDLVTRAVTDAGNASIDCIHTKVGGERFLHTYIGPASGVRFVDLSVSGRRGVREVDVLDSGAGVDCPVCNREGDRCAWVERVFGEPGAISRVRSVDFGPDGPSEPRVVYETNREIELMLFHP